MALGRVVPARRAIAASSAREGEKARNMAPRRHVCAKSRKKLVLDVFLVVDYDSKIAGVYITAVFLRNCDSHTFTGRR